MKKAILFFFALCFFGGLSLKAQTNQITLKVNMSNQTVSPNGVHVAGNFQGWSPSSTVMTNEGNGIYSYTFTADEFANLSFKFINGNDWPQSETVPSSCGLSDGFGGFNRILETGGIDVIYGPICFGGCENCITGGPTSVNLTLRVNMSEQTVSPNGVHVAGNIQGWNPSTTPMTLIGNGIYEVVLSVPANQQALFKFINGNDWPQQESAPLACAVGDGFGGSNRTLSVGSSDLTYGPVCFSACENCQTVVEPAFVDLTLQVNMSNETVAPEGVHVAGNFQGWNPSATPLTDIGNGIWEGVVSVPANNQAIFKFINGNVWPGQEAPPLDCAQSDGFGGSNRVLAVADQDLSYGPVCFNECNNCTPIVEPTFVTVVFQVNMSNATVSPNGVHLAGNFQGWNPNGTVLNELGGGIYEIAYEVEANTTIEFRFINGSDWPEAETVPADCGSLNEFGDYNRTLNVGDQNLVFGPVCFGSCTDCEVVIPTMVIFQVNMSNETVSNEGVYVAGSFNDWDATATQMVDAGNGLYQAIAFINPGSTVQYKFLNGPDFAGVESVPQECGVSDGFGGFNRQIEVGDEMITTEDVCFSSCIQCLVIPTIELTFNLDMAGQQVNPLGVFVAGSFNDFSPSATPLTNTNGTIYSTTITVGQNESIQYKFLNGNDWPFVETVPFECGVNDGFGGFNRQIITDDVNINLPLVCFSSCVACAPIGVQNPDESSMSVFPNPATSSINIYGEYRGAIRIFNQIGSLVRATNITSPNFELNIESFPAGAYTIVSEENQQLSRFIKY